MRKSTRLLLMLTCVSALSLTSCKKEGCTDVNATNYNSKAKKDDGSCIQKVIPPAVPAFAAKIDGVAFLGTLSTTTMNNKINIQSTLGNENIALTMPQGIAAGSYTFDASFGGSKTALYSNGNNFYGADAGTGTLIITSNTAATVTTQARIIGSFSFTANPTIMNNTTNSYAITNGQFNVTY